MANTFTKMPNAKNSKSGNVSLKQNEFPKVGDTLVVMQRNNNKCRFIAITEQMIMSIKDCKTYKLMKYK